MQRTICGLSRLCHNAARQCSFVSETSFSPESRHQYIRKSRRPIAFRRHASNSTKSAIEVSRNDDDLLARCRPYNIRSISELDKESDLDLRPGGIKRLTDTAPIRTDLRLWDVLLDYRIRHYGTKGAATIWRGLKYGGPRVSLESEDELTTRIWQKLLTCAAEHNDLALTKQLCEPGGLAWRRPRLFAETISTLLRSGRNFQVGVMCDRLKSKHASGIADVLELYRTFQPQDHDDLKAFCSVYDKLRPGKMYEQGLRHLFGKKRPEEAFLLHKFLVSRGDFPTSFSEIEPFMKHLAKQSEDPGPFLRSLAVSGAVFWGQGRRAHEYAIHELAQHPHGNVHQGSARGAKPWANKVSDTFAAKAFTTKALSFDFVLNALMAFGLTEIGPQSIREIGLHAASIDLFSERLAKLDELGIDTGGSAYSRFVRKTCQAREDTLLLHALQTDMHHDVFEDPYLQAQLLAESLSKCAWTQVNLLLAMLNHGHFLHLKDSVISSFLASIIDDDLKARTFLTLLSTLAGKKAQVSSALLHDVVDYLLLRLRNSKTKDQLSHGNYRNRTRFTAGLLQGCVIAGARLTVPQWRSLFGQLGRSGALQDVHKLTLWLLMWYSERVESLTFDKETVEGATDFLARIFDGKFQRALVYWALREQFTTKLGIVSQPWRSTLMLLQHLHTHCEIPLQLWIIRKTIVLYVRGLFHRSMPAIKARGMDSRPMEARRMCFMLFRNLNEILLRDLATAKAEKDIASNYLMEQKDLRAHETVVAARPTLRKAMRRFPYPMTFTFNKTYRGPN